MQKFDSIRPFYDAEVNEAIHSAVNHPMMKALMGFTFPDVDEEVWKTNSRKHIPFVIFSAISSINPYKKSWPKAQKA